MNIVRLAVFRPVMISMALLFFSALGFYYYNQLVVNLFPAVSQPTILITTVNENESASGIEHEITEKIEKQLTGLSGLNRMRSLSREGTSSIALEYRNDVNMDEAIVDITEKINTVKGDLPLEAKEPLIERFNPTDEPVVILTFPLTLTTRGITRNVVENIKENLIPALERIAGISKVEKFGFYEDIIILSVDRLKMENHRLTIDLIKDAVDAGNVQDVVGFIENDKEKLLLQVSERFRNIEEIGRIPVKNDNSGIVYLKDVAYIDKTKTKPKNIFRVNAKPTGALYVYKGDDGNIVEIAHALTDVIERFYQTDVSLPTDLIQPIYNQNEYVESAVKSLQSSIFSSILLTALILFIFLWNVRAVVVALIAIPLSIVVSFIFFYFFDLTINLFSLTGITLAVGMIVDAIIVVLENVSMHCKMGKNINQSIISGVTEVSPSILASTLTTIIVFFPLFYLEGIIGDVFTELCFAISFVILISFFVSLTAMPLMGRFVFQKTLVANQQGAESPFEKAENYVIKHYLNSLMYFLEGDVKTRAGFLFIAFLLLITSIILLPRYQPFPSIPQKELGLSMTTSPNVREEAVVQKILALEDEFNQLPAKKYVKTMSISYVEQKIEILLALKNPDAYFQVKDALEGVVRKMSGFEYVFKDITPLAKIVGAEKYDVALEFLRYSEVGSEGAFEGIKKLVSYYERRGLVEVIANSFKKKDVYHLEIDRRKLRTLKLSARDVVEQIQASYLGEDLKDFVSRDGTIAMKVQVGTGTLGTAYDIESFSVVSPSGDSVPVKNFAKTILVSQAAEIRHDEQRRIDYIQLIDKTPDKVMRSILEEKFSNIPDDAGYEVRVKGSNENAEGMGIRLLILTFISCILVYMLLAALFESLIQPFIIILTIPLSFIGAVAGLLIFGEPLTISAGLGIILLIGIAVNNGILLVQFTNIYRERDMELLDAVIKSATSRLKPILMTSITTFIGMIPLILSGGNGAELYRPLSQVVVTGLLFSTFFTIYFIPVSYYFFEEVKGRSFDTFYLFSAQLWKK